MEPIAVTVPRSSTRMPEPGETGLDSFQFNEEIRQLMTAPSENTSSFTALLELPATQAMELLHSPEDPGSGGSPPVAVSGGVKPTVNDVFNANNNDDINNLSLPCNSALIERAAKYSVFAKAAMAAATENFSGSPPETSSVPSNSSVNLEKVKSEPTDSSQPLVSDPTAEDNNQSHINNQRSTKRKEREKKVKGSSKKSKSTANEGTEDAEKLPYVHVRARRGQATDSHSLAERARREKINARMKLLQELVPGCNKISGTALVLDEIINHVQSLQRQVEFLSMRLAAVNPRIDFNLDSILASESGFLVDSNYPSMAMPLMWPEVQVNGDRQQYQQQQWHFDALNHPVWGREDSHHNFITPENSLLSYDSSANSASLHSSHQLKMEL